MEQETHFLDFSSQHHARVASHMRRKGHERSHSMFDYLNNYGMLDYHYWTGIAAALFVMTVLRDMIQDRSWAGGR